MLTAATVSPTLTVPGSGALPSGLPSTQAELDAVVTQAVHKERRDMWWGIIIGAILIEVFQISWMIGRAARQSHDDQKLLNRGRMPSRSRRSRS